MENKPCFRQLQCGEWAYCVEAHVFDLSDTKKPPRVGLLAVLSKDMLEYAKRGEATAIVQFRRLVVPGTIMTRHVFQGLQRPLLTDGDKESDQRMLVYTRRPSLDYWWHGLKKIVVQVEAPKGKVFSTIVTPNDGKHKDKFPEVDGWIDAWTWVNEDSGLSEASINWVDRYNGKIWTREDR